MSERKLILAPGETAETMLWPPFPAYAGDGDVQAQRRIGAAVVLREMAERLRASARRSLHLIEGLNDAADQLEARARELES